MYIFAEPVTEDQIKSIQMGRKQEIEDFERTVLGLRPKEAQPQGEESAASYLSRDDSHSSVEEEIKSDSVSEAADQDQENNNSPWFSTGFDTGSQAETTAGDAEDSSAPADDSFLDTLTPGRDIDESKEHSPLLGLTLSIQNRVDGKNVTRPERLRSDQSWAVEYQISEIKEKRGYYLYEMCKKRRQVQLDQEDGDTAANYYLRKLRDLSMEGERWRDEQNKVDDGKEQVVLSRP